ncbi:hypothetical protein CLV58_109149 [Spirosoma oryzae]|uniref:Uncharacterized protein n=1 Tax=Spirosoma oryzae TaxID=1469603 RepID=A0A2T0SYC1_9BACT|nr:hypothetical protein [Spirosoma oryzae]PRY38422.1 hypothetical protein CLV58_109149 [Spirosoma oryzae]
MAKKKNIYTRIGYDQVRAELDSTADWLSLQVIEDLFDDIEYKVTQTGGIAPLISDRIEDKLKGIVNVIHIQIGMLTAILEKDGLTSYVEEKTEIFRNTLEQIQQYYQKRPVSSIESRKITKVSGKTKTGASREITFVVATKYQQIANRNIINDKVLKTLPLLEKLEEATEALDVKGDYEVPISLQIRGLA